MRWSRFVGQLEGWVKVHCGSEVMPSNSSYPTPSVAFPARVLMGLMPRAPIGTLHSGCTRPVMSAGVHRCKSTSNCR